MQRSLRNQLFVNGQWLDSAHLQCQPIINPADESIITEAPLAGDEEVEHALVAARSAFDQGPWPQMSNQRRVSHLRDFHTYLLSQRERIIELIVAECGATQMAAAVMHFDMSMKHAAKLLEEALSLKPESVALELSPAMDGTTMLGGAQSVYEPVGVVAAITAYNFPYFLNIVKLFHALTTGNVVILKPSPYTPLQAFVLGEAAVACDLPAGVLNILNGELSVGERLTTDIRVDMVSFTGSDVVGSSIMQQAAPTLKRLHMELGGKSALIVRSDADLQRAAQAGLMSFTLQAGQGCALTTRHLVHNDVRAQYVDLLRQMASLVNVGNPRQPDVTMGPLIRAAARERVERYISAGIDSGANLVFGGDRPAALNQGYYLNPTLFDNVDHNASIAQEEIFGPVGVVIGFDSDEEALGLANESDYGLGGMIYSGDAGQAYRMALQMRTGGVAINGGAGTMLSAAPFGGYKRSGFGRELGKHGLLDFCQIKNISYHAG
ncbi:aldehyde dehydrogenase family protein [Pseudomaricurvus alkylphenolicus]|uniref:aldehyde dehydrogenase family protein n=1 Tax=Pseudomaricurvus alkylphenolicus TaxID=1306991 RepID=UPI001421CC94|nr:aldehyde dehydrogenase family protein [Pseudomaricurvus alkylphenolicus]NIB44069.1 aldehyde dehydrogenase family protein [Pseudomaricurvus alkylphenolicus]